jgi:hypothetical protein
MMGSHTSNLVEDERMEGLPRGSFDFFTATRSRVSRNGPLSHITKLI